MYENLESRLPSEKHVVLDVDRYYACTYDIRSGYQVHDNPRSVYEACKDATTVITFNGKKYDHGRLELKLGPEAYILREKSLDLYLVNKEGYIAQYGHLLGRYPSGQYMIPKGDLTLSNICYATLGKTKYQGPDLREKVRIDVEMTADLFRYMARSDHVYHTTYRNKYPSGEIIRLPKGWWQGGMWIVLAVSMQ